MNRLRTGWQLLNASVRVLRQHPRLMGFMVVPIFLVLFGCAWGVGGVWLCHEVSAGHWLHQLLEPLRHPPSFFTSITLTLVFLPLWFVVTVSTVCFEVALVSQVLRALRGEAVSVTAGWRFALSRWRMVVGWSALTVSVGTVFSVIGSLIPEKLGRWVPWVSRVFTGFIWALASTLVIPILVCEGVGPWEALKRSTRLLKRTWGENIATRVSFSGPIMAALLVVIPLAGVVVWGLRVAVGRIGAMVGLGGFMLVFFAVASVLPMLNALLNAMLYQYAVEGAAPAGFDPSLMERVWVVKGGRVK